MKIKIFSWMIVLFVLISLSAFADDRIMKLNTCAINSSQVTTLSGSPPVVFNGGDNDCRLGFSELGEQDIIMPHVNTSNSLRYTIANFSICNTGLLGRFGGFYNTTYSGANVLEENFVIGLSCNIAGAGNICYRASVGGSDEDAWLKQTDCDYHLYNITDNGSVSQWFNIPERAGQVYHLNFTANNREVYGASYYNRLRINVPADSPSFKWNFSKYDVYNQTFQFVSIPNITIIQPTNNSVFNKSLENLTYGSFCTDTIGQNFSLQLQNESNVVFSIHNSTFLNSTSTLNGQINLMNVAIGDYLLNFTCRNSQFTTEIDIVSNVSGTESPPNPFSINITTPANNSVILNPSASGFAVNVFVKNASISTFCNIFRNNSNSTTQTFTNGNTSYLLSAPQYNSTWEYRFACSSVNEISNISYVYTLEFNNLQPPIVPESDELFTLGTCPLTSIEGVLAIGFLFLIAFAVMIGGHLLKLGLMGVIGAFLVFMLCFLIYSCFIIMGIALQFVGILLIWYFIKKGWNYEL